MKILTLSRSKLELAQTQLRKPLLVIGRSPTCDVVLRAPGIKPVHFIIEWIGSGLFDSQTGSWSIVDVSSSADAGEGVVLSQEPVTIGDLSFRCIESKLESSEMIGGTILESMGKRRMSDADILEFVQVRTDTGAIEEVQHFSIQNQTKHKIQALSKEFKTFKIELPKMRTDHVLKVLFDEMPGAEVHLSGRKIDAKSALPLRTYDFLQVSWNGRDFYLRFVEEIISPPIPRDFWGNPLLKKLTLAATLLILLLVATIMFSKTEQITEPELPRVARVEIPPPPPPPPTAPLESAAQANIQNESAKAPEVLVNQKSNAAAAKAAAAKQIKEPTAAPKAGLNTAAPVQNVNQIGLLGALNKNAKKGPGIQADQMFNEGIIHKTISGEDSGKIVLKTPPSGVIGSGSDGAPNGNITQSLGAASTTLSGITKADPNSRGLIARKGGESGYQLGSATSGDGVGMGNSNNNIGGIGGTEGGDFSVVGGGLDRETVRRIIASYRSQIRTCYERGLIANPNLEGRIVYKWQISPLGSVVTAQISKATLESANLKACVLEVIQKMNFPKAPNGLPTTVIYPFVFQGKK